MGDGGGSRHQALGRIVCHVRVYTFNVDAPCVELTLPDGTVLGFHVAGGKKRSGRSDHGWSIMLKVKWLENVVADLKRQRIRCGKIEHAPGGGLYSTFHDPDRNRLVLLQF